LILSHARLKNLKTDVIRKKKYEFQKMWYTYNIAELRCSQESIWIQKCSLADKIRHLSWGL
jgi:hypothetical protein